MAPPASAGPVPARGTGRTAYCRTPSTPGAFGGKLVGGDGFATGARMAQDSAARADREIVVVGKACPLPLVLLAKTARELRSGQTIRITGNDPMFEPSVVEFCRERRHAILETERRGRTATILIRL